MRAGKRFVVGFDTEDDGKGNPFLWCFVHARGSLTARSHEQAHDMLRELARQQRERGHVVEVWATNLEYDLLNLFPREMVAQVVWYFGRSYLCAARWRGIEFRDTVRHLPASVEQLGEMVGAKKLQRDLFHGRRPDPVKDFERYRERCLRDAAITYRAARDFHRTYRALGVRPRSTLPSTALSLWRDRYWKRPVVRPAPEVWNAAHAAYHGGRVQAFAAGEFRDVQVIDAASMFPWAMTSAPLPLPWGMCARVPRGGPIEPLGLYLVDVESEIERPLLPVRTNRGTIFPNGRWRGWYVGEELCAFLAAGGVARVVRGYHFHETCRPFDGYVRAMFRKKNHARGLKRSLYKLLLNGLYGKFGQSGTKVRCIPLARYLAMSVAPEHVREWNGLVIFQQDGMPPPWGNDVWPAFVTARARVRLAQEMDRLSAGGARILYCDTDSVMFDQVQRRYPERATVPGTFENRGRFRRLLVVGKKEYALETSRGKWDATVKGVPLLQRYTYLTTGTAEFQRPMRMREAAARNGQANVWHTVKKVRRVDLRSGARSSGNALPVPWIDHGAGDLR